MRRCTGASPRFIPTKPTSLKRCAAADAVIGAVLVTGARAPRLVTREMLSLMPKNSVIVDVAVDQGGCVETTHATTHSNPTYFVDDVLHYGVANMPGAVPRTSSYALSNATLRYAIKLAGGELHDVLNADPALAKGLNSLSWAGGASRRRARRSACRWRRWKRSANEKESTAYRVLSAELKTGIRHSVVSPLIEARFSMLQCI